MYYLFSNVMYSLYILILLSTMTPTISTSTAIVVYSPDAAPFARFRETTQRVTVGDGATTVTLEQDWSNHGVAGVLWDSATVLIEYLLRKESNIDLKNKSILELGAGLGLPSISISLISSPLRVVATEQTIGMDLLQRNVKVNEATVEIVELDWSNPLSSSISNDNFDIILGADLVYKEEAFQPLIQTLGTLTRNNTVIYFASRIRYAKDRRFYRNLAETGFRVEKLLYDQATDVYVYKMEISK